MKSQFPYISLLLLLFLFTGCDDQPASNNNANTSTQPVPVEGQPQEVDSNSAKQPSLPDSHQCLLKGTVLEDNSFWIKPAQTLVGIVANETTKDIDFGDSHRVFIAMNTVDCSIILQETLPVNRSPDFPWYLNTNTYEPVNQLLCMQGTEFVYCYDAVQKKLLPQMKPQFLNKRIAVDAQSGIPAGLAIYNRYLLAFAVDQGAYAFDLRENDKATALLPNAEYYSDNDESYHSLFLLEDENGMVQALMPGWNEDQDGMISNPLFKNPLPLNTTINSNVRNNRFIILASKEDKLKTVVDMEKMIQVVLPADVATKPTKEILDWLKK